MLGFSIGGMVTQEIVLQAPNLVRRLILVGTGPRGGHGMASLTQVARRIFGAVYDPPEHLWLAVLFSPSAAGQVNAVWTYEAPYAAVSAIREYLAFYPDRVDAIEVGAAD